MKMNKAVRKLLLSVCSFTAVLCAGLASFFLFSGDKVVSAESNGERFYALAYHEYTVEDYSESVTVKDPLGNAVQTENGTFVPIREGDYVIRYKNAEKTLTVFLSVPVSEYTFSFELQSEYGTGEMLILPEAQISSAVEDAAAYTVYIEQDGVVAGKIPYGGKLVFQPEKAGEYTVIYTYIDIFGYISNRSFTFNVTDKPVISFVAPVYFSYGATVGVDAIYAYNGAEKVKAVSEITAPDGSSVNISSGNFVAGQIGKYKWKVTAEIGGQQLEKTYEISCDIYSESLFSAVRMAKTPVSQVEIPETSMKAGEKGVLLEATSTGATYQFNNVIDLNAITKDKNILTFFPYVTEERGYTDDLIVKLTDIHDNYNSISIQFKRSPFHDNYTYVTAEYGGRHYAYDNENWVLTGVDGPVKIGDKYFFGGLMPGNWSMIGKSSGKLDVYSFSMDYKERQMILDLTSAGQGRYALVDYDNPVWVGGEEYTWHGFTTGEVYLSVEFGTVTGKSAAIIVTEVMGQRLDGFTVQDNVAPSFTIDADEDYVDSMPYGVTGTRYNIPAAKATDTVCGETEVEVKLYKGAEEIEFSDNFFIPAVAGDYEIKYTATDARGNTAGKTLEFTVYGENDKPQLIIGTEEYTAPVTGKFFKIPEVTVSGASGKTDIQTTVRYNGAEVSPDAVGKIFIDKTGEIKITAKITDWLGQTAEKEFVIPVNNTDITFTVPNRHGIAQKGRTLTFENAVVNDFVKDEGVETVQKIYVNGTEIADNKYTVKDADANLTVRYEVTAGSKTQTYSYNIPVYGSLSDLFDTDGQFVIGGSNNDEVRFNFTENGKTALVNPVSQNLLKISFAVTENNASKDFYVDLRLKDSANSDESVFVRVTAYDNSKVRLQLNGKGDYYILDGSFATGVPVTFFYDCEKRIFKTDVSEREIFALGLCENGDVFSGFTSGAAYFEMEAGGLKAGESVQLRLVGISNETFVANLITGKDVIAPVVSLPYDKEIITRDFGEEYVISPAKAYDAVQGIFDVKVTVILPDGTTPVSGQVLDNDYVLKLSDYGRYTVIYETFEPIFTIKVTKELFIDVTDKELPEITLKSEIISEAALGDVFTVVGATAADNITENITVKIIIYDSNYRNKVVKEGESYRFVLKGRHRIVYLATDEAGNTARIIRYIEVK